MTVIRSEKVWSFKMAMSAFVVLCIGACGPDDVRVTCDDLQPYQSVTAGKRIVVPDGLTAMDELKEMPVPKSETPPRAAGLDCIENPPSILTGGTINQ